MMTTRVPSILAVAVVIAGCGRFGFESSDGEGRVGDASPDADADADADAGPPDVVRFRFDELVAGSIAAEPAEYSVTCNPCPTFTTLGRHGGAYIFFGGPRFEIGHPELITNSAPYSISLWYSIPPGEEPATDFLSMLGKPLSPTNELNVVSLTVLNGKIGFEANLASTPNTIRGLIDTRDDMWHHVVATYDGVSLRTLYVDNVLIGTDGEPFEDSNYPIGIGGDIDGDAAMNVTVIPFIGALDDVRFYRRELNAAEVQAIFEEQ